MRAWPLMVVAAVLGLSGCKAASDLTDKQAAARNSGGVEDVCPPRDSDDDIVLIDRTYAGTTSRNASSAQRGRNAWFMRVVFYDAATGARRHRVTVDKIFVSKQNSRPDRVSCLGWMDGTLWLWSRREGLHARDATGAVVHSEEAVLAAADSLAPGIQQVGFAPGKSRVWVATKDGRRWLLGPDLELEKAPRSVDVTKRRRSQGPGLRVQGGVRRGALRAELRGGKRLAATRDGGRIALSVGGKSLGDYKHVVELLRHEPSGTYEWDGPALIVIEPGLDRDAPRTLRRVGFDGQVAWTIREPEPCSAPHGCPSAAWQATRDAKRLYFYGKSHLHAFDAATGEPIWSAEY